MRSTIQWTARTDSGTFSTLPDIGLGGDGVRQHE
jgi:hypothetical protein